MDVLSTSYNDDSVVLYTNSGARPPVWTRRVISTTAQGAATVYAIDLDQYVACRMSAGVIAVHNLSGLLCHVFMCVG